MRKTFSLLLCLLLSLGLSAQKNNVRDYISIRFVPNHADWVYAVGEEVEIEIAAIRHYVPVPDAEIRYEWGMEQRDAEKKGTVRTAGSGVRTLRLPGAKQPGFKTLTARVEIDGRTYTNTINLAFAPDRIAPTTPLPADFEAFWQQTIEQARKIPLKPLLTPLPDHCTPDADVYEVRFQNFREGHYLYGTLAVPRGVDPLHAAERYPAIVLWPGAGVKPHPGDVDFFPAHGIITLEMGINGIPVNLPQQVYTDLRANALHDYNTIHLDDRDQYYYRRVYAGTVKTVDFLCSLPCVDTARIGCYGGSQGGALTIVHAALDPRIKAAAASYPALAEIAGYVRGRAAGWPKWRELSEEKQKVTEYYDVVNFARYVRCPVWFMLGYNDQVCCPTSTYAVFNTLTCSKSLLLPLDCAHWMYTEHKQRRAEWLLEQLTR
ncbi:MAG: acetylxylan esterase [Paludibacteraceae bacterium]